MHWTEGLTSFLASRVSIHTLGSAFGVARITRPYGLTGYMTSRHVSITEDKAPY